MTVIVSSTAYSIPLQDKDHYLSVWSDHPATAVKIQLKSMLTGRSSKIIELDPRAAKMLIKAAGEIVRNIEVS